MVKNAGQGEGCEVYSGIRLLLMKIRGIHAVTLILAQRTPAETGAVK
jgi:hypothetical protein